MLCAVTAAVADGQLVVTGDASSDTVAISHAAAGTTAVNGQFFPESQFPGGIVVNAGGGNDVINLVSSVLPVTLDGQDGTDSVTVGQSGNAQGVLGAVFVQDSGTTGGETSLMLDDHADTGAVNVLLSVDAAGGVGTIAGLCPGTVTYGDARVTPFVRTGSNKDEFRITGTDAVGSLIINAGAGNDRFDILKTGNTAFFDGEGDNDNTFNLTDNLRTGSIGEVFIDSDGGKANVVLKDSGNPSPRTIHLTADRPPDAFPDGVLTGLTAGNTAVHFDLNETKFLSVEAGFGGNTFDVVDVATPNVSLRTGGGNDTVTVRKSSSTLNVNLVDGNDQVNVGDAGNAQGVTNVVTITQSTGGTYGLKVDDSADTVSRNVVLERLNSFGSVKGLAPAEIKYFLGLKTLYVLGGSGGNTFSLDEDNTSSEPTSFPGSNTSIDAGGGNDVVNVLRTRDKLRVDGTGGVDTFNVGRNNNTQGIRGQLFMVNLGGRYSLNFNDAADTQPRNILVTAESVTGGVVGLTPGGISYHLRSFDGMTLNAGSGGNTITFDDPNTIPLAPESPVTINSGTGIDTVSVLRTFQPVTVRGQSSNDVVRVGLQGSVQGIRKPLLVSNVGSRSDLIIDDSTDPVGRNATMSISNGTTTLAGLAPGAISYFDVDMKSVTISAGPGGNTFTVDDTPESVAHPVTTLNTGTGVDTVNVRGTTGALTVNGQNGRDTVSVGANGSVQSIKGTLTINNSGSFSAINIDDSADDVGRTVTFGTNPDAGQGSIINLAPAVILYRTFDLATLTVKGGTGADTFNVNGTAINVSGPAQTVLQTGGGVDTINVRATSGPLLVNAGAGNDVVNVGSPFNTLDPVLGNVMVIGNTEFDVLTINDQGSTTPHVYTVTTTTVARPGAAIINYSTVENLRLNRGNTGTGGTPTTVQGLSLPATAERLRPAALTGRLVDPDASERLTLAVDWGDGSLPNRLTPGTSPFAFRHWYRHTGNYTVRVIWTDSAGQSNFQELHLTVVPLLPTKLEGARKPKPRP